MTKPAKPKSKVRRILRVLLWTALAVPAVLLCVLGVAYLRSDNNCVARRATTPANPMKAVTYCEYGSSDVVHLEEIEKPVPGDSSVLVRVHAAAANPLDWHYMHGTPYVMRLDAGLRKPKVTRLGVDYAGVVESVGKSVTKFKPGDEVFGGRTGAFAEYITINQNGAIAHKPANITFEQAAALGVAASTALQGLRDRGQLQPGQRVLINGASGGVGTFAVQIAKIMGARVTAVNSTRNIELVKSLGADAVVDYTKSDYTKDTTKYDLIIDNVGNHSFSANRRVLTPNGRYVIIGGGGPNDRKWVGPLGAIVVPIIQSPFVKQKMGFMLASLKQADLETLAGYLREGKLVPVIDRTYEMRNAGEALGYLEEGRARGKVVLVWNIQTKD